jgi:hypothetical protein
MHQLFEPLNVWTWAFLPYHSHEFMIFFGTLEKIVVSKQMFFKFTTKKIPKIP